MNKECSHTKYKSQKHKRIFQDEVFPYKAKTCADCGSILWNDELQKQFNMWLIDLHKNKRHLFQVQYQLSDNAIGCIEKLNERFLGIDQSLLIRALVMVNLEVVEDHEEILEIIEESIASGDYLTLIDGDKHAKKLQFKPSGMLDILAYADMLKIRPGKIVEESLYRIVLLSIRTDPVMKEFWENTILKSLEIILKAA
ncbi:MAG: hypothetical protein KAQ98_02270 [Bacteriovoracaceae bacterium]|nr:hypothetical protein [Bacteriovoracaceae bacterium]